MIDLKKECQATVERPRLKYSAIAKLFFWGMDLVTGKKTSYSKAKLLETLACIPYREWEIRKYAHITRQYAQLAKVKSSQDIIEWARYAQDNEYWHLLVLHEKMKEDGIKDAWYLAPLIRLLMVMMYVMIARTVAFWNIRWGFDFNAQFEDHAEHVYAQFVKDNPGLDQQNMSNPLVKEYADLSTWGDIFRRISLDERDHMNNSFLYSGQEASIVRYKGMPI